MTFVFIHTGYLRHPKVRGLNDSAIVLHLASILWTAEHLTDGFIPLKQLGRLSDDAGINNRWRSYSARRLVECGLWDEVEGGWHVHDFEVHNRSSTRAVVEANRKRAAERQQRYRAAKK